MSGLYVLAAIPVVLWACMLYVLVVEPVRLYLHDRRAMRRVHHHTIGRTNAPAIRSVTLCGAQDHVAPPREPAGRSQRR